LLRYRRKSTGIAHGRFEKGTVTITVHGYR
jgi:hypothetical protein